MCWPMDSPLPPRTAILTVPSLTPLQGQRTNLRLKPGPFRPGFFLHLI